MNQNRSHRLINPPPFRPEGSTCRTMQPALGAWVQVRCEDLWIECEVKDIKNAYGRVRVLVQPLAGEGTQWVELSRTRYSEATALQAI